MQNEMNKQGVNPHKWQLDTPLGAASAITLTVMGIEYALGLVDEHLIATFNLSHLVWDSVHGVTLGISLVPILYFLVFRGLREKEQRFQLLYDSARDAIVTVDDQALISGWNPAAQQLFQYRAEEALGQPLHQLIAPLRYRDDAVRGFAHFHTTGEGPVVGKTIEITALRKDGSEFPVELSISSVTLNRQHHAMGIVRDITERKQSEEALLRSENKNRILFESSRDALMLLAPPSWKFTGANRATLQLFGASSVTEFTALGPWKVSPEFQPDGRPSSEKAQEMIGIAMREGAHFFEWQHQRLDGIPFAADVLLTRMEVGGEVFIQASVRDITERKQAERHAVEHLAEIERARLEWQAVFDAISDPIFLHDETLHITRANLAYARAGGMNIHDVIGQPYWKVFPRADGPMRSCQMAIEESGEETEEFAAGGEVYLSRSFMTKKLPGAQYSVHIFENITGRRRAEESQLQSAKQLRAALEDMISAIAATLEQRDPYTAGHQRRVAQLAVSMGEEMGLSGDTLEGLHLGGLIHDIGKISVPAEILGKPGLISDIEFALIKVHAEAGYEILKNITFPWPVAQMVYQHHERLDGSGYPQGLAGEQIIVEARILAVADTVEAMSANRPYRPGLGMEAALNEIARLRGTALDPLAVDACLRVIREKGFVFSK